MKTLFFIPLAIALFTTCTAIAGTPAHRQIIEQSWLDNLRPKVKEKPVVGTKDLEKAILLLNKTVELVQQDGGSVTPEQKAEVKTLNEALTTKSEGTKNRKTFFLQIRWLRREILLTDPKLDFDQILINRNPPTMYSHNGDQNLGRHSRTGPGLTVLTNWKTSPEAKAILEGKLPSGATRNPALSYEADRVVFAFCNHNAANAPQLDPKGYAKDKGKSVKGNQQLERRYFLYEAAIDGSWIRQITGTTEDKLETQDNRASVLIEDNDPCYLPDDDIIFISTRSQSFGRCHGSRYNPGWLLYRCKPDGSEIKQLSFGNENEHEPEVLNDGRIIFTRWEYTNRHEMYFHKLWACRPDGTGISHFYGNDTLFPMMVVEATPIPGTHKVTATAQGHHQYNTGTTIVIDTNIGENGEKPLTHMTPETPYAESSGWPKPHYSHPYPITEHLMLASRANHIVPQQGKGKPVANDRAIYLIDDLGGREFLYEDPSVACVSPIPIRPRKRPPVLPSMLPENAPDEGTLFLQNVYLTRNDPDGKIKPGAIKAIRINALGVKPRAAHRECTPYVSVEIPKKVIGTVPVSDDGSACFTAPAKTALQIQALDADGRAILTEKSFFYLHPGENRSCVGCHEPVGTSPDMKTMAGLMQQKPVRPTPAAGPDYPGGLAFMKTVQPVLDRYCISCHGLKKTAGGVNLTSAKWKKPSKPEGMDNKLVHFPSSYAEITKRGDFTIGAKNRMGRYYPNISKAYEPFYARSCSVADMILKNHGKINMDEESRMRIFEWMDLNAQMNGDTFPGNNRAEDRKIKSDQLPLLRKEIKRQFGADLANDPACTLINIVHPEESRILMAPLASSAGGWGQLNGWATTDDPNFIKMHKLVYNCVQKPKNENNSGWKPSLKQGASESWVAQQRALFLNSKRNTPGKHDSLK